MSDIDRGDGSLFVLRRSSTGEDAAPFDRYEDIFFVLSPFDAAIFVRSHAVAVFLISQPLSFVFQTVAAFADAEARSFIVSPLSHVAFYCIAI